MSSAATTRPDANPGVPAQGETEAGPLPPGVRSEPPQPGGDGSEDPGALPEHATGNVEAEAVEPQDPPP